VVLLVQVLAAAAASPPDVQAASKGAKGGKTNGIPQVPVSPLKVALSPKTSGAGLSVDVAVTSTIPLRDVSLDVSADSSLQIVSSNLPGTQSLKPSTGQSYRLEVRSTGSSAPQAGSAGAAALRVSATAAIGDGNQIVGDQGVLLLTTQGGQLKPASPPAAPRADKRSPMPTAPADGAHKPSQASVDEAIASSKASAEAPSPRLPASSLTATGSFFYCDHAVTETGVAPSATSDPNNCENQKPIRRARVELQKFNTSNSSWEKLTPTSGIFTQYTGGNPRDDADCARNRALTDCDGPAGVYTQTFSSNAWTTGDQLRAIVCTVGPYGNGKGNKKTDLFSVVTENTTNSYCAASTTLSAPNPGTSPTVNLGSARTLDTDANSGPFKVYDAVMEGYEYLTLWGLEPSQSLRVEWSLANNPTCGSCYQNNIMYLNGSSSGNPAQWDVTVIEHELGHYVMEQYLGGFPAGSGGRHGQCTEGFTSPGMGWTEGFATFFSSAVRSSSLYADVRNKASKYLDANGGIGATSMSFNYDMDAINGTFGVGFVDTEPQPVTGLVTNKGNFCEWAVAATLWDVIDGANDNAGSNRDTLTEPFSNVFNADLSTIGNRPPANINEWWYGWVNSARVRSTPGFGKEQPMLNNFGGHAMDVGVLVQTRWNTARDLDAHLWLPSTSKYHVQSAGYRARSTSGPGNLFPFPYAILDSGDVVGSASVSSQEQDRITSPYAGSYRFAVNNYEAVANSSQHVSGTGAQVFVFDASRPTVHAGSVSGWNVPGGSGDWWWVFDMNVLTGAITSQNNVQASSPAPYTDSAFKPGAPEEKKE
jgi:hypothetical protein